MRAASAVSSTTSPASTAGAGGGGGDGRDVERDTVAWAGGHESEPGGHHRPSDGRREQRGRPKDHDSQTHHERGGVLDRRCTGSECDEPHHSEGRAAFSKPEGDGARQRGGELWGETVGHRHWIAELRSSSLLGLLRCEPPSSVVSGGAAQAVLQLEQQFPSPSSPDGQLLVELVEPRVHRVGHGVTATSS